MWRLWSLVRCRSGTYASLEMALQIFPPWLPNRSILSKGKIGSVLDGLLNVVGRLITRSSDFSEDDVPPILDCFEWSTVETTRTETQNRNRRWIVKNNRCCLLTTIFGNNPPFIIMIDTNIEGFQSTQPITHKHRHHDEQQTTRRVSDWEKKKVTRI